MYQSIHVIIHIWISLSWLFYFRKWHCSRLCTLMYFIIFNQFAVYIIYWGFHLVSSPLTLIMKYQAFQQLSSDHFFTICCSSRGISTYGKVISKAEDVEIFSTDLQCLVRSIHMCKLSSCVSMDCLIDIVSPCRNLLLIIVFSFSLCGCSLSH